MIHNLKLFWKFALLAFMIPVTITIIAGIALTKTSTLKYEYDNLYGFMLIPLLEVDKGNLHREKLSAKLDELSHSDLSADERTAIAEAIRVEDQIMTEFIARYESEWLTTLSPEFTATLAALGQQHLQTIEAETLAQFHEVYDAYVPKREALLAGKTISFKSLTSDLARMETTFDSLVKVNRKFADYSNESAQTAIVHLRWMLMVSGILLSIFVIGMAWWLAHQITKPMVWLSQMTQQLAQGNLDIKRVTGSKEGIDKITLRGDEIGDIGRSFDALAGYFKTVIEDIVQVSQGLAEGTQNVTPFAEYRGEFVQIKNALTAAATKLADSTTQNATQDWLKTRQAQLNDLMSGEQEIVTLAKNIIAFLTTCIEAQVGLFYLLKDSHPDHQKPYLQVIASYAGTVADTRTTFLVGEGLVGQAALSKQTIFLTQTPEECPPIIRSGFANALPRYMLLLPCLYENTVKGIIEIGSAKALTDIQRDFLEQAMPNIGIAVNTAESRTKMQELLVQSQRQTEKLQSQSQELQSQQEELQLVNDTLQSQRQELEDKQTELQLQNEELQSQTEELQSQSEELQTGQEELRQTNEELELRTRELERQKQEIQHKNLALEQTQTEMEKAQAAIETKAKELELASKYKSEFLANMSHELRTPLNSLLILSQLLQENSEGHLTEQQVEYAQTIYSAGQDLLTLINDILDLSKMEAGKVEVHVEELLLAGLVETVEHKFRPIAEKKGVAFHVTIASDLPPVLNTDGQRLKQIINNLLSNAFKFTSDGEICLTLQRPSSGDDISSLVQDPIKTIAISVTDTGIGIPEDKQHVIFEAFQQADGTTSRRFGGTGLGLSISRQLARLLGGDIQLQSIDGKGSTFTLYLPETVLPAKDSTLGITSNIPAKAVTNPHKTGIESLSGKVTENESLGRSPDSKERIADDRETLRPEDKTLLIIEDDRNFSSILMTLAREKEFKCIVAEDGKTGLQLAEKYHPHAIILDVGLPQLDGWRVMERLKDNSETRHIPVHFMSASEQDREAKQMGAIGYLLKPISMAELGNAFKKIERFITKTVKNLLVVVDNEPRQQALLKIVEGAEVKTTVVATLKRTTQELQIAQFDCLILDVDVAQQSGFKILEQLQYEDTLSQIPVIIYAERELTEAEEKILQQCANNLTLKAVRSPERLLDEATLFLHQVENTLPADKQQMLQMVHNKEAILSYKKVMIVDDDVRNAFALTTVLEGKNMEVIVGDTGKEALELLDEHTDIAIVLMDIMMPEMDGYEAMREIRKQPRCQKLPIIALTAKAMKDDKAKCIEAGANDYLAKPVDTEKLISLMRVWLYR